MFGWFRKKPERTVVSVRTLGVPAKYWQAEVHYDVWGDPYIVGDPYHSFVTCSILPGGRVVTSPTEAQWRYSAGPDITWPDPTLKDRGWHPREMTQ